jgi:ribonuclease-3
LDKAAAWLKESLGYEFKNTELLEQALTHRSAPGINNERLEYLGDAVLEFVISEAVFGQWPDASEGVLSRLRSSLVKDTTLAKLSTDLGLGDHLILGPGEKKSGGHRRASILADALEAIFAAVYLDSDFEEARRVIHRAYGARIVDIPDSAHRRDAKTRLQEFLQSKQMALAEYRVERIEGEAHRQTFSVRCSIEELHESTIGRGTTRREAEQQAAEQMLLILEDTG